MLQFARSRAPFLAAALLQASTRRAAGAALFQLRPLARLRGLWLAWLSLPAWPPGRRPWPCLPARPAWPGRLRGSLRGALARGAGLRDRLHSGLLRGRTHAGQLAAGAQPACG